jgi:hypothetical protein
MRSAGNFSPEWGYLAPAPSLARTARVVLVATAIGATAGAGVVLSLVERPAEAQNTPIAARAIVTSVRETAVPSVAPTVSTATVASPATAATGASVSAHTPVATSAPPPALKLGASARTAARAMPQAQRQVPPNPPLAAPPSTVVTATSPPVLPASATPGSATSGPATSGPATSAPSAPATSLSASDSAPTPATAGTTANANASVAAVSSSAATAAIESSEAADAAPADVTENPSIIGPESPPKKAKRHASSKSAPAPGLGSILRRLFVAHSGRSYYPRSANGGL